MSRSFPPNETLTRKVPSACVVVLLSVDALRLVTSIVLVPVFTVRVDQCRPLHNLLPDTVESVIVFVRVDGVPVVPICTVNPVTTSLSVVVSLDVTGLPVAGVKV